MSREENHNPHYQWSCSVIDCTHLMSTNCGELRFLWVPRLHLFLCSPPSYIYKKSLTATCLWHRLISARDDKKKTPEWRSEVVWYLSNLELSLIIIYNIITKMFKMTNPISCKDCIALWVGNPAMTEQCQDIYCICRVPRSALGTADTLGAEC